jgi:hypothetical protein
VVNVDVEEAFDNTSFESIDDAASGHGVCSTINRWIDFMLRSRSVFFISVDIRGVRVHEYATWLSTGGYTIAIPLEYGGLADSLLNRLGNCNCFGQSFADDEIILICGKFLSTIYDSMPRALKCVQNWCG